MIINQRILQSLYDQCNEQYFYGFLPDDVGLYTHNSFSIPGKYDYTVDQYGDIVRHSISISKSFDWDEGHLIDVLLHEMIHEYVYYEKLSQKGGPHGESFQYIMNEINRRFGRHITIDQDLSRMRRAAGTSKLKWWFANTFS